MGIRALSSFLANTGGSPAGVVLFSGLGPRVSESSTMLSERSRSYAAIVVGSSTLRIHALARCLDNTDFEVVAMSATADQVIIPDVSQHNGLVLILHGRDLESALHDVRTFRARYESGRVAVLLEEFRWPHVLLFFEAGAQACLPESVASNTFVKSLELIMLSDVLLSNPALSVAAPQDELTSPANGEPSRLSPQEERILEHLISGNSNKVIARVLDIAETTAKVHVKAILRKLRLSNRTQAAVWALGRGHKGNEMHPAGTATATEKTSAPPE
jgi:two-component system nitrate/nitrite response regulator NarL